MVTNTEAPAAEVVQRYKSLADIERGFRALKSDIEIGPVYHRLPRRIRAHALVCFLALILHRVLRMRLKASQRPESPARLLEQLRRVQQQTARTVDGQMLRGLTELGVSVRRHHLDGVGTRAQDACRRAARPPTATWRGRLRPPANLVQAGRQRWGSNSSMRWLGWLLMRASTSRR